MATYALIKNTKVFNTIKAEASAIEEIGLEKLGADVVVEITGMEKIGIGYSYVDGVWSAPVIE